MEATIQNIALPNGEFTLVSPTGEHRTLKIRTMPDDSNFAAGKRVISLLVGPDNTRSYKSFGFVFQDRIQVWSKFQYTNNEFFPKLARMLWTMAHEENNTYTQRGAKLKQSRRCVRCNRKLTTPESIKRGLGPICENLALS